MGKVTKVRKRGHRVAKPEGLADQIVKSNLAQPTKRTKGQKVNDKRQKVCTYGPNHGLLTFTLMHLYCIKSIDQYL